MFPIALQWLLKGPRTFGQESLCGGKNTFNFWSLKTWMGCKPCNHCIACVNTERATTFSDSTGTREYTITHTITCDTIRVVFMATCPCNLKYIGLTSRELKRRIRKPVLGIQVAANEEDTDHLKMLPRHIKQFHNCDVSGLKVRGIDRVLITTRGGDWKKTLAQIECKWIYTLATVKPLGLNEGISYAPFL